MFGPSFSRKSLPHPSLDGGQPPAGGILLRLERMIPPYGIIVKHKLPYVCLFRKFLWGDWRIVTNYNFQGENCTFWAKSAISEEPPSNWLSGGSCSA
jgi:hypothetical protein